MEVELRAVEDADLPVFFEWQRDPASTALAGLPARDRAAFEAHWARIRRDPEVTIRTVVADGEVAGNVLAFVQSGKPVVGYWIGREHWGCGIATRALAAFLREVTARPLYATVAPGNSASVRVLEKCGFTLAGEVEEAGERVLELVLEPEAEGCP
jgi:RimJ/RimL family protein N-acetyltransferase